MKRGFDISIGLLSALIFFLPASPLDAAPLTTLRGATMGTTFEIKIRDEIASVDNVRQQIKVRLDEINARMSTYINSSEVSQFNRTAPNEWFPVSPDTATVVTRAQEISRQTDGAFDITVGPLVRLWNFGVDASDAAAAIPDKAAIDAVRGIVGYEMLEVRNDPPALQKRVADLQIDLSAIAKGYAVDEVARILDDAGLSSYMVEIGGEIRVRNTDAGSWKIGIEAPITGERRLQSVFVLDADTTSLASSGDYRNYREIDGKRYSHTIDPKTARPVEHLLSAVTVNSPDCISADAYATALMVMGPTRGSQWAEENQVAALLLVNDGDKTSSQQTSHFTLESPQEQPAAPSEFNYLGVMVITLVFFTFALIAMAIGVIVNNRRIKGSCGGLAGLTDNKGQSICDACTKPSPDCSGVDSRPSVP